MSRFIQLPIIMGAGQDSLLTAFIEAVGESLSNVEVKATDFFVKKLRRSDLLKKIVYVHPFLRASIESRSFNLIDPAKHKIAFTAPVTVATGGVVFNAGKGVIDGLGGTNSTDLFIGLYAANVTSASLFDLANATTGSRVLLVFYGNNTLFDVGWTSGTANEISVSGLNVNNAFVLGNVLAGTMSLWKDGIKADSKTGGITVPFATLNYNASGVNNPRIYKFSILGSGLTDEEVPILSRYINEYMAALGRNV